MPERISLDEFHARLKAQGRPDRAHIAMVCPVCKTVQSLASLIRAGCDPDQAELYIGFSCEGRLTGAGPWPSEKDYTPKAKARRQVRGCNWTLGGLFQIQELEVITDDGQVHPRFAIATPEQAMTLQASAPPT